jgi:hypothetical protein
MINEIFKDMINVAIIAYINYILFYSQTQEEYEKLIKVVLSCLQIWNLVILIDKCMFHKSKRQFLDYLIFYTGVNMANKKF